MTEKLYEIHPYCEIIPEIDAIALDELTEDIRKNGLNEPIVLYDGKILDGRSRFQACSKAQVEPKFANFTSVHPIVNKAPAQTEKDTIALNWVVSRNVSRRHLDSSQRAMVASRLANMGLGQSSTGGVTRGEAAKKLNVSTTLVSQASTIAREAPEKVADIESGKTTISKVVNELKASSSKEKAPSAFAQAVIDGTFTGKAFRKEVGKLSKLVDHCVITLPLVEYFSALSLLKTLENFIAFSKNMSRLIPVKDLEKRVTALQTETVDLCTEIDEVLQFGSVTFHQMYEVLEKQAASDEEKALLATVENQFEERWEQVLEDLKTTEKTSYEHMEAVSKKESAKAFVTERKTHIAPKKK
jgi:hypothetical protein